MAKLILVRHGKSEWNKIGLWTGQTDVELAPEGHEEAEKAGQLLFDIEIHRAHTSALKRTHQTLEGILRSLNRTDLNYQQTAFLNERHYGIHQGKNKWEIKEQIGEDEFTKIRRSWDHKIPEGETLKDVYDRVVPYYENNILPDLRSEMNVLVVAHGNSLRALIKYIEVIHEDEISSVEIGTGELCCYDLDKVGNVLNKEIRGANSEKGKV
jgi:2,3-bisphosphoglycerate-dependent phosphoglycerate mutase